MIKDILMIVFSLFASLGFVTFLLCLSDRFFRKNIPAKFYLVADDFRAEDAECVLRCAERLLLHRREGICICEIRLGENAEIDRDTLVRLCREYKNIAPGEELPEATYVETDINS